MAAGAVSAATDCYTDDSDPMIILFQQRGASVLQVNTQMLRGLRSARGVPEDKLTANTLTPDESAKRIMAVVEDLNLENTGSFWAADTGKFIGW